jgi:hypothetical protein
MSSSIGECSKCGYVGPPEPNKAGCPKCGEPWKSVPASGSGLGQGALTNLEITTLDLTDKELDDIIRSEVKRYFEEKLAAAKVTKVDIAKHTADVKLRASKMISDPDFASAATAWVALRSQEQQANLQEQQTNVSLRLEWWMVLLTIALVVIGVLAVVLRACP